MPGECMDVGHSAATERGMRRLGSMYSARGSSNRIGARVIVQELKPHFKRTVRRSMRRFGLDLRRTGPGKSPDLADFLFDRGVEVTFDVGANVGQFGKALRERGYRGRIVSFEPITMAYEEVAAVAARDGNWEAHNLALGAEVGRAVLNVSQSSVFSSMRDQSPITVQLEPAAAVVRQEQVSVGRLDDFAAPFRGRTTFLKIDTQGYERPVLDGAREALRTLAGVQLELPVIHLYRDTWQFTDAVAYMSAAGFVISQLTPVEWLPNDRVSVAELDAVFRRCDALDE
jgi:FkbM family methyltransferase